jgi:hypothetical protein
MTACFNKVLLKKLELKELAEEEGVSEEILFVAAAGSEGVD